MFAHDPRTPFFPRRVSDGSYTTSEAVRRQGVPQSLPDVVELPNPEGWLLWDAAVAALEQPKGTVAG